MCCLRLKPRKLHTIVSWSRRRNPTGPWHKRTKVNNSLQGGKSRHLENPIRMWSYSVLGVTRCFENGICTSTFPQSKLTMTPTIVSSIAMYPRERDYVKSPFENPGKVLTSKCPKNDKNPHDYHGDCPL